MMSLVYRLAMHDDAQLLSLVVFVGDLITPCITVLHFDYLLCFEIFIVLIVDIITHNIILY